MISLYDRVIYLSDQECKIYNWTISLLNGTRNPEDFIPNKNGIDLDYKSIYKEYLNIHETSENEEIKLEILKRLIFLNWAFCVEPSFFTGIEELDEIDIRNSYSLLNTYIKFSKIDSELKWMIKYYSEWEFEILKYSESNLNELTQFVKSVNKETSGILPDILERESMANRGQMGIYWKEIIDRG